MTILQVENKRQAQRRDTAATWASTNPVLADGEIGLEKDTRKFKWGDGVTAWNDLDYGLAGPAGPPGADGADGTDGTDGADGADGAAATIEIGTVTTGAPGSDAEVTNSGTDTAAVLDFTIPAGENGTGSGDMLAANNLSDVDDADTAWTNLGGGTVGKTDYPGSPSGQFLKDDGTFDTPAGGGGGDAADVTFDDTGLTYFTGDDVQEALSNADAALDTSFQPLDADLTAIAGLDSSTSGVPASDGSGWIKKTYAQLKTALSLTKSDVGLGNVDNTSDADKPVSTAQAAADAVVLASAETYADGLLDANNAMQFKGVIDCSTNPNYPAANAGWTYKVSVAGKIGGSSGINVEVGDSLYCLVDSTASGNQATVGAAWNIIQTNIDGAVVGPASSTAGDFATFSGTTGKVVQDSGVSLDTDGTLAGNSDSRLASQKAVKTYADAKVENVITSGHTTVAPSGDSVYTALAAKAPLASPAFTGHPTGVTESAGDNSTRLATTAYADAAVAAAKLMPVTTITAAETMQASELGGLVRVNIASGSGTITTPTSGAGSMAVGWSATYQWVGTIQPVFAAGSGASITNNATGLKIAASGQAVTVICIASNTYTLIGALAA